MILIPIVPPNEAEIEDADCPADFDPTSAGRYSSQQTALPRIVISAERKRGDSLALKVCGPVGRYRLALHDIWWDEEGATDYVAGTVSDEKKCSNCGFFCVPCNVASNQRQ